MMSRFLMILHAHDVPVSHDTAHDVPGSHASAKDIPGSHASANDVPDSHATVHDVPGSNATVHDVPGSNDTTHDVSGSHAKSQCSLYKVISEKKSFVIFMIGCQTSGQNNIKLPLSNK